jgi:hypothetical protein
MKSKVFLFFLLIPLFSSMYAQTAFNHSKTDFTERRGENFPVHSGLYLNMNKVTPGLFTVMPNPSNGQFTLFIETDFTEASVIYMYDPLGKLVHTANIQITKGGNRIYVDRSDLASGIYYLSIPGAQVNNFKIVITK